MIWKKKLKLKYLNEYWLKLNEKNWKIFIKFRSTIWYYFHKSILFIYQSISKIRTFTC